MLTKPATGHSCCPPHDNNTLSGLWSEREMPREHHLMSLPVQVRYTFLIAERLYFRGKKWYLVLSQANSHEPEFYSLLQNYSKSPLDSVEQLQAFLTTPLLARVRNVCTHHLESFLTRKCARKVLCKQSFEMSMVLEI
ncbi:hypothetical protein AVEN_265545-1 [Araneus ventricosus]|uniref:Uncharacterized protein n=1 Tax=Araneus ventricosus TaxID=182803 RepID=A0A4Y2UYT4_ARAVE|nr:hypothetical protein AVEN_265545-1 [Araneus ventricosus]